MESGVRIKQETVIKSEPGSSATAAPADPRRLQSFRVPQDLTLGGITNGRNTKSPATTNKRVYTPNLNVVRNKNVDVQTASSSHRPRAHTERNRNDRESKNRKSALIQTSGIFSDGLAQRTIVRNSRLEKNSSSKEPGEALRKPVFARTAVKIDPEEETKRLHTLYNLNDVEDDELEKVDREINMPVKLENPDYKLRNLEIKTEIKTERDLSSLIPDGIFLLQLPDALPGKIDTEDRKDPRGVEQPEVSRNDTTQAEQQFYTVRDLDEGCISKIVLYRSGKMKLIMKEMMFDLSPGMESGFLQVVVSINANTSERSGNIIELSTITAKLNASPDWEHLFKTST